MGKSAKPIVVCVVCNISIGSYMQKDVYYTWWMTSGMISGILQICMTFLRPIKENVRNKLKDHNSLTSNDYI